MPDWIATSINILTLIVMLFGLFGLIMPVFPGLVIIWLAALGFGIFGGFGEPRWLWTQEEPPHMNMYAFYKVRYTKRTTKFFREFLLNE